jgi:hypothetical protein
MSSSGASEVLGAPDYAEQAAELSKLVLDETDFTLGDVVYAISESWYLRWDSYSSGSSTAIPGPVDNRTLSDRDFPMALRKDAVRGKFEAQSASQKGNLGSTYLVSCVLSCISYQYSLAPPLVTVIV